MKVMAKKIGYVLFLILFLFPLVEKEIHHYEHKDDFRCTTKNEKHLHSEEHYCFICDFNIPITDSPVAYESGFVISFITVAHLIYKASLILVNYNCCLPPRAPPAAS